MKKIFTLLTLVFAVIATAQAPQGFNYQATVRNSSGALIINQNVYFKFNIMLGSQTTVPIYSETHYVPTDDLGQVNLTVGQGTPSIGSFAGINWGSGSYYLGIELNTGAGYVAMGTTQLMSVPYALYAENSCDQCLPTGTNAGDILLWNGSNWISTSINNLNQPSIITNQATSVTTNAALSGGTISSDGGNSIIAKGICWSINPNPTTNDSHTNEGAGAGSFSSVISNLTSETSYYYRAYIINSSGTYYGNTYVLTTTSNVVDESENALPVSGYFKKRVLLEDYTGTWNGNCTRVAYAIEQMYLQSDKVVSIAIHNGNDPYHFPGYQPLSDLILPNSVLELPQSRINRTVVWTSPEPSNLDQAKSFTSNNSGIGLAMSSTVNNGIINLDVNMKFAQNYTGLKLAVYVVENHLIHSQSNYTIYYGSINPVPNFEHNHVLRHNLTNILGDPLTESTTTGQTITKGYSIAIPTSVSNQENISFVAVLINSDNLALNARAADKNEVQVFEQNP